MKKVTRSFLLFTCNVISGLFLTTLIINGQEPVNLNPSIPADVYSIVSFSCMPCHTSQGGFLSREKLNFTNWNQYSPEKQKEKAEKMYSELKKGAMPPKTARENKPEIIPTKEQVLIIKKWADSLNPESN